MPLVSALGSQRHVDLCDFKASLLYIASSRPAGATGRHFQKNIEKTERQKGTKERRQAGK